MKFLKIHPSHNPEVIALINPRVIESVFARNNGENIVTEISLGGENNYWHAVETIAEIEQQLEEI